MIWWTWKQWKPMPTRERNSIARNEVMINTGRERDDGDE